jgi:hypothetical protein
MGGVRKETDGSIVKKAREGKIIKTQRKNIGNQNIENTIRRESLISGRVWPQLNGSTRQEEGTSLFLSKR